MRTRSRIRLGAVAVATMAAATALTAPAASAKPGAPGIAVGGTWAAYSINSQWSCGPTLRRYDVYYQGCVITNGRYYQAATIVTNHGAAATTLNVITNHKLSYSGTTTFHNVSCDGAYIGNGGTTRACFSPTSYGPVGAAAQGYGRAATDVGFSYSPVRYLS